MRLRILSDLHVECFQEGLTWAAERFAGQEIIYVPGNHEFYGTSMPDARKALRAEAKRLGIHLLDNDTVNIGGVRSRSCPIFALSSNQRARCSLL